jgi:hypothetical protein
VTRRGDVVRQNVIRETHGSPGGEAVLLETASELFAVVRQPDGSVSVASV